jgi:serine/threonine protein kinase
VQPISIWKIFDETFVSMPAVGFPLDMTPPVLDYSLLSIARQLIDGVEFIHQHGVAHLDLKPRNVLLDTKGYLTIIDFSVSEWLHGAESMTEGFVGTEGYTAPEVGQRQFSPILADVWACGNLVDLMCEEHRAFKCEPWIRGIISQIATELMHADPRQRLRLSDGLVRLGDAAASQGDCDTTPPRYIPPWSTVIPRLVVAS